MNCGRTRNSGEELRIAVMDLVGGTDMDQRVFEDLTHPLPYRGNNAMG